MADTVGEISSITLPNGLAYGFKDGVSRQSYAEMSNIVSTMQEELSSKSSVYIKDPGAAGYEDGKQSDLSIVKLPVEEYAQLVALSATEANTLYIMSSEYEDLFGMQIKNMAAGTDLSDAVTVEQLSNALSSISIPEDLSSFTNSPGYVISDDLSGFYVKSETSSASEISTAVASKLESVAAAPAFDSTKTYSTGEYTTYEGMLYYCSSDVVSAGSWTGSSNWVSVDMTTPDATLDIQSDGRLRVVAYDGEVLWMEGYDLAVSSSTALACDKVNLLAFSATSATAFDTTSAYAVGDITIYDGFVYKFLSAHTAGAWNGTEAAIDSVQLTMPSAPVGKVGDFILDVDNSANLSAGMVAELDGMFTSYDVYVEAGKNITDILTFQAGEQCELYFTMTAFSTSQKPAWKVVKQIVEKQEFGS